MDDGGDDGDHDGEVEDGAVKGPDDKVFCKMTRII